MKTKLIAVLMFLMLAGTAMADQEDVGTWSVGLAGGGAFPIAAGGGAIASSAGEYPQFSFDNTAGYGANVMYRFPEGWTARVEVQHQDLSLNVENGTKIGILHTTPVMVLVGYQGMPSEDGIPLESGFTGHGELGGGIAFNSFDQESGLAPILSGATDVVVDNGYAFEFGVGGDYFFNRNFSMNLDLRYLVSRADTSGWNPLAFEDEVNKVAADTGQAMLGVRYWFK